MDERRTCPECGAIWPDERRCRDYFDQMLAWEFEAPGGAGAVHHLTVLCYHLQHPSLYSPAGLAWARAALAEFVEQGMPPQELRRRSRRALDSGTRAWNVTGAPASYAVQPRWATTVVDAASGGLDGYKARVAAWARSVHAALAEVP